MDELTEVRELRSGAPTPDRARVAPGRARLLDAARTGERRHRMWARPGFVIAGVVATVTAVAVTASLLSGRDDAHELTTPAALTNADLKRMSARELLERAAEALERQPKVPEPGPRQWIYTRTTDEGAAAELDEKTLEEYGDWSLYFEDWTRFDGAERAFQQRDPYGKPIKVHVNDAEYEEGAARTPIEMYRALSTLPTDGPGALKALREENALIDRKGATRTENDYIEIAHLLGAEVKPPKGLAGLYRALATLPDLSVVDHMVEDASGRKLVALNTGRRGGTRWLIDPETYQVLGTQQVKDGRTTGGGVVVDTAVVDEPGERG
ncbi:CU044_5270 family protein [Streptomyces sp. NBC_00487]|uniref:CU044_5270 family protein n=1 Tax=unclassified Streptomyces TaxID=2593676 RepID=UPI002E18D015|nr:MULTISPECIES: CU044_5270 family protein [unclassified Streptomyces]